MQRNDSVKHIYINEYLDNWNTDNDETLFLLLFERKEFIDDSGRRRKKILPLSLLGEKSGCHQTVCCPRDDDDDDDDSVLDDLKLLLWAWAHHFQGHIWEDLTNAVANPLQNGRLLLLQEDFARPDKLGASL